MNERLDEVLSAVVDLLRAGFWFALFFGLAVGFFLGIVIGSSV